MCVPTTPPTAATPPISCATWAATPAEAAWSGCSPCESLDARRPGARRGVRGGAARRRGGRRLGADPALGALRPARAGRRQGSVRGQREEPLRRGCEVGGRGEAALELDELRWMSQWWRGVVRAQPERRPLALRGERRGVVSVDLLRSAQRHAGLRRIAVHADHLEAGNVPAVPAGPQSGADPGLVSLTTRPGPAG